MTSRSLAFVLLSTAWLVAGCSRSPGSAPVGANPTVVTDVVDGFGSVSCTQVIGPDQGAACTVTASAGYALTGLTDNGVSVLGKISGDRYDIARVTVDHAVSAAFSKVTASNTDALGGRRHG